MATMYRLISGKGTRQVAVDSKAEAVRAAVEMERELQPAHGVTVEDEAGATVAEVRDGVDIDADED